MKKLLFAGLLLLLSCSIWGSAPQQPLPVDKAFPFSAELFGNDTVLLHWNTVPDHYLYRDRFKFKILSPTTASIGSIIYPSGKPKQDEIFGKYEVYPGELTLPIPIIKANPEKTVLEVTFQGCAEDGYCYPPTTHQMNINFTTRTVTTDLISTTTVNNNTASNQEQKFSQILSNSHLITIFFAFIGFGILLSFTPCVLPMLPILSGIIVGHRENITTGKALRLSFVYVLSMAITYAVAGVLVGMLGGSVQAWFQKTWVLVLFSALFVALALSFFGFYQLRMPRKLEELITQFSGHQKKGHYIGVAIMGCLATLIVSPCVTPALVGVLGYIGQTGDATLGGIALFALGLGMGLPIMIVGTAGGKLLPKAGAWMKTLEAVFGVVFLGMAIFMLDRVIPSTVSLLLWAALLIVSAIYMGALSPTVNHGWGKLWKGLGLVFLVYGILMMVGVAEGNDDPFKPLTLTAKAAISGTNEALFTRIKSLDDLNHAVLEAKSQHKPVFLDFYADWCLSCQEMKRYTFKDPAVLAALKPFVVLQADVTANDAVDKTLMQHFQVIAPPTLLFFNPQGEQMKNATLVGKIDSKILIQHLQQVAGGA
ncbi:MAG TPA: protein-disulfide reductase DsbD [Gammaproteobacteria bacterium]|nr:protein-disulfide reductase DsbD [Gammaproteobacteria bacterium]